MSRATTITERGDMPEHYGHEQPARTVDEVRFRHEENRAAWNEGATRYAEWVDETVDFIRRGESNLHPLERENLGDLRRWCHRAIHLQCASGRDTLSLLNEGVDEVVGIDISDVHIDNARRTSLALGSNASWHRCDVLDTPDELDGTADLVYTGRGALCWLHDINGWGRVVARLLKPGGVFHVFDDHPLASLFEFEAPTIVPNGSDYFTGAEWSRGWHDVYIGDLGKEMSQMATKHEQTWPLSAIFNALTSAGLRVDLLKEYPVSYWSLFPNMPDAVRATLPLTFAMRGMRA